MHPEGHYYTAPANGNGLGSDVQRDSLEGAKIGKVAPIPEHLDGYLEGVPLPGGGMWCSDI